MCMLLNDLYIKFNTVNSSTPIVLVNDFIENKYASYSDIPLELRLKEVFNVWL